VSPPGPRRPRGSRPAPKPEAEPAEPSTGSVRLQKILARAGVSSRRGGEALITAGRVTVNDAVVTELGARVDPAVDQIAVDGRVIQLEAPVYFVMNKPDGVVCSAEPSVDERGRPTVMSLVRGIAERVYPVGRLDYHTRGVLLLTNDGDLAARLTHPRHKVQKTYHVKFQGQLQQAELEALSMGVTLEDGTRTQALAEISVIKDTQTNTWAQLTVMQGLYRQVRRMGDAIGHPVLKLIRVSFAGITADGLDDGEWRQLREDEVAHLRGQAAPKPAAPKKAASKKAASKKPASKKAASKKPATKKPASKKPGPQSRSKTSTKTPTGRGRRALR
jgi:23S rRNA pseudouridine2605 synthase